MTKKHLEFYNECMKTGKIPEAKLGTGLCNLARYGVIDNDLFKLFIPTYEEKRKLIKEGLCEVYWGSGLSQIGLENIPYDFTPLRQNIVLFMAAINGEL